MVTIPAGAEVTITPATAWELDVPTGYDLSIAVPSTNSHDNRVGYISRTSDGHWMARVHTGDSRNDPWGTWAETTADTLDDAIDWCHTTMARGYASIRWD